MIKNNNDRNSGVELLKVLGIILIIISHVSQSLTSVDFFKNLGFYDGFISVVATKRIDYFLIYFFRYFGMIGNLIFIVSSSYYLSGKYSFNKKKVLNLAINTFVISILFLFVFLIFDVNINFKDIIKSFFPLLFQNNWFITIYLLFIMIVPYLNIVINQLTRLQFFRLVLFLFILYFVIGFIKTSYDLNNLIIFISVYFIVNYLKSFHNDLFDNRKICFVFLALSLITLFLLQLFTNLLGLNISLFQYQQMHWVVNNNPLVLIISLSLFGLFKTFKIKSSFINKLSALSLYIYLFHENHLFRHYSRIYIWHYIYENIGYGNIILIILIYSVILFLDSCFISFLYKYTFEKIVSTLVDKIFAFSKKHFNIFEQKIIN